MEVVPFYKTLAARDEQTAQRAQENVHAIAIAALATTSYIVVNWWVLVANQVIQPHRTLHLLVGILAAVPWKLLTDYANAWFAMDADNKTAHQHLRRIPWVSGAIALSWTGITVMNVPLLWVGITIMTATWCLFISLGCVTAYTMWVEHCNARH